MGWYLPNDDRPFIGRARLIELLELDNEESYPPYSNLQTDLGNNLPQDDSYGYDNNHQYQTGESSKRTVQERMAINNNAKLQTLSQDLIRRLLNTKKELGVRARGEILDNYATKLWASGYKMEQVQRILVSGIKG